MHNYEGYNYKKAVEELLESWKDFNSLIATYRNYVDIMMKLKGSYPTCRKLKIDKISETFLREEFPNNSFLRLANVEDARDFLNDLTPEKLETLRKTIQNEKDGVFYTCLHNWIISAKPRIMAVGKPTRYTYDHDVEAERRRFVEEIVSLIE